jgi:hypothetical protein
VVVVRRWLSGAVISGLATPTARVADPALEDRRSDLSAFAAARSTSFAPEQRFGRAVAASTPPLGGRSSAGAMAAVTGFAVGLRRAP